MYNTISPTNDIISTPSSVMIIFSDIIASIITLHEIQQILCCYPTEKASSIDYNHTCTFLRSYHMSHIKLF